MKNRSLIVIQFLLVLNMLSIQALGVENIPMPMKLEQSVRLIRSANTRAGMSTLFGVVLFVGSQNNLPALFLGCFFILIGLIFYFGKGFFIIQIYKKTKYSLLFYRWCEKFGYQKYLSKMVDAEFLTSLNNPNDLSDDFLSENAHGA